MVKPKILLIFTLFIGLSELGFGQDPEFSQFYANQLYLNPAFAGSAICPRLSLNYRNQWPALHNTFITYNASVDGYLDVVQGGVGFHFMNDQQGDGTIKTTNVDAMYAYTLRVTRSFSLTGGFQTSWIQRKLDWNRLIFPDMIDALYGVIYRTNEQYPKDANKSYFDFSTGLLGFGTNYYFGIAVHHLAEPVESFNNSSDAVLPRKYTAHVGFIIPLTGDNIKRGELQLSPNFMYQKQQDFEQFNYGLYLSRRGVTAGFWLRQNIQFNYDAFIIMLGFVQDNFKLAYSYDITISKLAKETLGAHEISFSYMFPCFQKKKTWNAIKCPSF
ncbi:MAG: type IX secretion system membrane protein PorP/SprF [Bacteroidia bacterium]|nr:type IX secretion system membrane protein PorP/SprF [Bacteroidia bacterium]